MKIGLYGGSFNPIHAGHIAVAEAVRDAFALDCVLLMVAKDPPHKQLEGNVSAQERLSLTELALREKKGLCASALELAREGKSYTVDTVRALKEIFAGAELYCIVGADMLLDLPSWHEAAALMCETSFIAVGRAGVREELEAPAKTLEAQFGADIRLCDFVGPEISSTQIRDAIAEAKPITGLVPTEVETYIYAHGLYLPPKAQAMQEKLKASLKKERYIHSTGTMQCAIELAARFGADAEKARTAALLHDCGRFSHEEQYARCEQYALDVEELKAISPSLVHGPLGAAVAEKEYGIEDRETLDAIYWHTLCREDMTMLEKIVYLADKIEPNRDYAGVEALRAAAQESLDEAVLACMEQGIAYVRTSGKALHPGVLAARDFLRNNMR